jgi:uncharacterized membrane-anchored protein YitT (DUF2179 family)
VCNKNQKINQTCRLMFKCWAARVYCLSQSNWVSFQIHLKQIVHLASMQLVYQMESPSHCWKHNKYHQIESKNVGSFFLLLFLMNLCNNGFNLFSWTKMGKKLLLFRTEGSTMLCSERKPLPYGVLPTSSLDSSYLFNFFRFEVLYSNINSSFYVHLLSTLFCCASYKSWANLFL